MRLVWLVVLIASLTVPWAPSVSAEEPGASRRYARLEAMNTQARAAWAGEMLKGLDQANGVVLSPEAVASQHARFQKMLAPLVENQPGWQSDVARFESELSISQRAAIEHLVRRYRVENYRAFHGDRAHYEQRRRLLEQFLARWQGADSPEAEQQKVVEWLVAATKRIDDPKNDWLPPLPNFVPRARPTDRAIAQSVLPDVNLGIPSVSSPPAELSGPKPSRWLADHAPALPEGMVRPETVPVSLEVRLPLDTRRLKPKPLHVALRPSLDDFGPIEMAQPTELASFSRASWHRNGANGTAVPARAAWAPSLATAPAASSDKSGDPMAFARMKIDRMPTGAAPSAAAPFFGGSRPLEPEPGRFAASPAPRLLPGGPAALSGVSSSRPPANSAPSRQNGPVLASLDAPATAPGRSPEAATGHSALPNVGELASRIRGNNVALRNLAAELYEDRQWDARSLGAMLDRLAPLVARKDDLKLIRELVPASQRERVGELESGSELISDLGSKIARVRSRVENGKFQGTLAERKAELDRLDQLSRRLAQLVFDDE